MTNADVARIVNLDEVQSVLNAAKDGQKDYDAKRNATKSTEALELLDPYAAEKRRMSARAQEERTKNKAALLKKKREARTAKRKFKAAGKAFYAKAAAQGSVCENGFTME